MVTNRATQALCVANIRQSQKEVARIRHTYLKIPGLALTALVLSGTV